MVQKQKKETSGNLRKGLVLILVVVVFHGLGFISSLTALDRTRTAQGTIAWVVSLNTFPYLAVPAYWVFGKSEFQGYIQKRRSRDVKVEPTFERLWKTVADRELRAAPDNPRNKLIETLTMLPVTTGNDAELLIDGAATYASIFKGIKNAKDYVLVQFYTIAADGTGNELKECLLERARAGVRCHVIFDGVGTSLPADYVAELTEAGVEIIPFSTFKGIGKRFQINFRNHRKVVIVDGREAWVGGLNIADAYRGDWRDTHLKVTGPVVKGIQISYVQDWNWAADEILDELNWDPVGITGGNYTIGSIPSGPSDSVEILSLFTLDLINSAKHRLWIASPYFVPDVELLRAMELAALRGVEVKILIPEKPDAAMTNLILLSSWGYVEPLEAVGAEIFQYTHGFMHQKVMLIDDDLCTIGTANFDARSFRLNFELTLVVRNPSFAGQVKTMLEKDFLNTPLMTTERLEAKGYWFNIAVRVARLAAPVL